jgi:hypothetical protein
MSQLVREPRLPAAEHDKYHDSEFSDLEVDVLLKYYDMSTYEDLRSLLAIKRKSLAMTSWRQSHPNSDFSKPLWSALFPAWCSASDWKRNTALQLPHVYTHSDSMIQRRHEQKYLHGSNAAIRTRFHQRNLLWCPANLLTSVSWGRFYYNIKPSWFTYRKNAYKGRSQRFPEHPRLLPLPAVWIRLPAVIPFD